MKRPINQCKTASDDSLLVSKHLESVITGVSDTMTSKTASEYFLPFVIFSLSVFKWTEEPLSIYFLNLSHKSMETLFILVVIITTTIIIIIIMVVFVVVVVDAHLRSWAYSP